MSDRGVRRATDSDAVAIGLLHQRAKISLPSRVFYLGEAGGRLIAKKETLGPEQWPLWLKMNESVLGFRESGARCLMSGAQWLASNRRLAEELEEIVTNPAATDHDARRADEIRNLISSQFRSTILRGMSSRRQNEWYTPREYISRARIVLGDIDLDPASTERAQEIVKARQFFDKEQDGLRRGWFGRVWLNPPYERVLIRRFIAKLLAEWHARRITACIALTHNYTDTVWFQDAASAADCICFTQGRVRFYEPSGSLAKPTQGQAFFYFGSEGEAFRREFGRIGTIVKSES